MLHTLPVIKTGVSLCGICLSCVDCIVFDVQIVIHVECGAMEERISYKHTMNKTKLKVNTGKL